MFSDRELAGHIGTSLIYRMKDVIKGDNRVLQTWRFSVVRIFHNKATNAARLFAFVTDA